MSKQKQFLTNAMRCAELVTLPLKNNVWKGLSGDFLGKGSGASMDFQEHRNYMPGDDPRHINWQAYARTGNYTMKVFHEEVSPTIDLIIDGSNSMFFSEKKDQRTSEIVYLIHQIALRNGASITINIVIGKLCKPVSLEMITSQKWRDLIPKEVSEEASPSLERVEMRESSIRVFISDLLFEGDPNTLISKLLLKSGKPIILTPFLSEEAEPEWSGNYDFVDAERKTKHTYKIDDATLTAYKKQYTRHFSIWKSAMQKYHVLSARVSADLALFDSLKAEAIRNQVLQLIHS